MMKWPPNYYKLDKFWTIGDPCILGVHKRPGQRSLNSSWWISWPQTGRHVVSLCGTLATGTLEKPIQLQHSHLIAFRILSCKICNVWNLSPGNVGRVSSKGSDDSNTSSSFTGDIVKRYIFGQLLKMSKYHISIFSLNKFLNDFMSGEFVGGNVRPGRFLSRICIKDWKLPENKLKIKISVFYFIEGTVTTLSYLHIMEGLG